MLVMVVLWVMQKEEFLNYLKQFTLIIDLKINIDIVIFRRVLTGFNSL